MIKEVSYEEYAKARELVDSVERFRVSKHYGRDLELKKDLLRKQGYDALYGKGNDMIPLEECSPAKLTSALFSNYAAARNKVRDYEDAVRSSPSFRNLVGLIEKEKRLVGDKLELAQERTAVAFDSARNIELELLSKVSGSREMGEYSRH